MDVQQAGIVEAAREEARSPTSNTPSNLTEESLEVVVKRVCLLSGTPNEVYDSSADLLLLLLYAKHVF